jgi:hypothetical protein
MANLMYALMEICIVRSVAIFIVILLLVAVFGPDSWSSWALVGLIFSGIYAVVYQAPQDTTTDYLARAEVREINRKDV